MFAIRQDDAVLKSSWGVLATVFSGLGAVLGLVLAVLERLGAVLKGSYASWRGSLRASSSRLGGS